MTQSDDLDDVDPEVPVSRAAEDLDWSPDGAADFMPVVTRRPARQEGRSAPLDQRHDPQWGLPPGTSRRERQARIGTIGFTTLEGRFTTLAFDECRGLRVWDLKPTRWPHLDRGRRSVSGWYPFGPKQRAVAFQSAAERDVLLELDRGWRIEDVAAQPFVATLDAGEQWPDYASRDRDGRVAIVEVKPDMAAVEEHLAEPAVTELAALCASLGWTYEVRVPASAVVLANLRWLRTCRPLPEQVDAYADQLIGACWPPCTVAELLADAERPGNLMQVLGQLLWRGQLDCNLDIALSARTDVWVP